MMEIIIVSTGIVKKVDEGLGQACLFHVVWRCRRRAGVKCVWHLN
jgi:hypothetical protein